MYDEWRGVPATEVLAERFEETAGRFLAERGYSRARVRVEFPVDTPELARALVDVARGPRTKREVMAWSGHAAVTTTELDALLPPRKSAGGFDRESIEWEVRQLYGRRGYTQVAVEFGEPQFTGTLVTRPVAITEGRMSKILDVRVDGVPRARLDAAKAALNLAAGAPFVPASAAEAIRRLQNYYRNLGYHDATVVHVVTPKADGDAIVAVTVDEGVPYHVGDVSITGVETTNDGLVERAITLEPGETASAGEAETTRGNLFEIGSFRRVDVSFVPPADPPPGTTNVAILVEEPKRFQLRYGGQLSTDRSRHMDSPATSHLGQRWSFAIETSSAGPSRRAWRRTTNGTSRTTRS